MSVEKEKIKEEVKEKFGATGDFEIDVGHAEEIDPHVFEVEAEIYYQNQRVGSTIGLRVDTSTGDVQSLW